MVSVDYYDDPADLASDERSALHAREPWRPYTPSPGCTFPGRWARVDSWAGDGLDERFEGAELAGEPVPLELLHDEPGADDRPERVPVVVLADQPPGHPGQPVLPPGCLRILRTHVLHKVQAPVGPQHAAD